MTEAEKLRAQKASSTDPQRLEWMACVADAFNAGVEAAAALLEKEGDPQVREARKALAAIVRELKR